MKDIELLLADYEKAFDLTGQMDALIFKIRGWAMIVCAGVVAWGVSHGKSEIILLNIPIIMSFLFFELIYRSFHDDALEHSRMLEEVILLVHNDAALPEDYIFGVGHAIHTPCPRRALKSLSGLNRWHIWSLYALMCLATMVGFLVA